MERLMALYVNDEKVDQTLIETEINRLRPSYQQMFADQSADEQDGQLAEWARENVIEGVLFRQEAAKALPVVPDEAIEQVLNQIISQEGPDGPVSQRLQAGDQEAAKLRQEVSNQIRAEQMTQYLTSGLAEPTEKEVRTYYQDQIERFTMPEMVHAAHIVKHPDAQTSPEAMQSQMQEILEQINSGVSFEKLASEHSDCADQAGDLGFFARGKMVQSFEDVVFNLDPGTCSGIFQTEFGLHIAKVYEKRDSVPCPLDQVKELIVRDLKQQAGEKAIEQFLDTTKETATIEERDEG
jgi:parvulin-like peptidyl-prolyl isomerase